MKNRAHLRSLAGVAVCLIVVAFGMFACAEEDAATTVREDPEDLSGPLDDEQDPGTEFPPWLLNVQPGPGTRMTSVSEIEVRHQVFGRTRGVRLIIDGTDITANAQISRGLLRFDPEGPPSGQTGDIRAEPRQVSPIDLDPGRHTAVVQKVNLEGFGGEREVLDSFEWTFTVL